MVLRGVGEFRISREDVMKSLHSVSVDTMCREAWVSQIPCIRFWIFALSGNETRCDTHKRRLHEGVAKKCEAVACDLEAVGQPILARMYRDVGAGARVLGKSVAVTNGSPCARAKGRDAMEWYWALPR